MIAEIMVNEKDASVLENPPKVVLFLHTRPELPINVKIISERFYPELTEQNIYSYNLKAEMVGKVPDLRYGMRGVARVTGQKVRQRGQTGRTCAPSGRKTVRHPFRRRHGRGDPGQ